MTSGRARILALALAGVLVAGGLLAALTSGGGGGADTEAEGEPEAPPVLPGRLLVFSTPGLSWTDLQRLDLPAIESFAAEASVANLVPRSVVHRSDAGDAYLTMSAGTRAAGVDEVDGEVLRTVEEPTEGNVAEVFFRRTGQRVEDGSVVLGWPELERRNAAEPFDADLGALADTLADAEVATLVIGNADGTDEIGIRPEVGVQRQVGLALADSGGVVTDGRLGADLLTVDPAWAFGLRLDAERVLAAFDEPWAAAGTDHQEMVALVEASDLARTMQYRPLVAADRYTELRDQALLAADAMFAELLERVEPGRDSVLLLAPYNQNRRLGLTVAALDGPGVPSGYLRSATTQRSGIVSLVDVAPSILRAFGITPPESMEGRPFEVVRSGAGLDDRITHMVAVNDASRFREQLLTPTTMAVVLSMTVVAAAATIVLAGSWSAAARRRVQFACLVVLAALPSSYAARAFPLEDLGIGFYWTFVIVTSLAIAVAATALGRGRSPHLPLVAVLVLMSVLLVADVTRGSSLSLNAAFGYSPTGNSRLYGISNYSYGQLAAAACLLAAIIASQYPSRRGRAAAIGVMVAVLVILGVPIWGSDVGGVLAFTPAVLLFAALLLGYRVRLRTVLLAGIATAVAVTAFGFLDLARPPEQRAHLGRLFERVGNEGLEPLVSIVERKLVANLRVSTTSFWVLAIPIGVAFWLFLSRHRSRQLDGIKARVPALSAGLAAVVVAAVLGSLLNDSGAIVGGVALTVVAVSLAYLATEGPPAAEAVG